MYNLVNEESFTISFASCWVMFLLSFIYFYTHKATCITGLGYFLGCGLVFTSDSSGLKELQTRSTFWCEKAKMHLAAHRLKIVSVRFDEEKRQGSAFWKTSRSAAASDRIMKVKLAHGQLRRALIGQGRGSGVGRATVFSCQVHL